MFDRSGVLTDAIPRGAFFWVRVFNNLADIIKEHGGPGAGVVGRPAGFAGFDEVTPGFVHGIRQSLRRWPWPQKEIHPGLIEIVEGEGDLERVGGC